MSHYAMTAFKERKGNPRKKKRNSTQRMDGRMRGIKPVKKNSKLSERARDDLPNRAFGLPSVRKYPVYQMRAGELVPSRTHAIAAKGRSKTALQRGEITAAQYKQIARKTDRVMRQTAPAAPRRNAAKRKKPRKRNAKAWWLFRFYSPKDRSLGTTTGYGTHAEAGVHAKGKLNKRMDGARIDLVTVDGPYKTKPGG